MRIKKLFYISLFSLILILSSLFSFSSAFAEETNITYTPIQINNLQEFKVALGELENYQELILNNDIELTETIKLSSSYDYIINLNNHTIDGGEDNTFRIFDISNGILTIRNGTIKNGNTPGSWSNTNPDNHGGAIYNNQANLTIDNITFTNNKAKVAGAVLFLNSGSVEIKNSYLNENTAAAPNSYGGIIHTEKNGNLILTSTEFTNNSITQNFQGSLFYISGNLIATDCKFIKNEHSTYELTGNNGDNEVYLLRLNGDSRNSPSPVQKLNGCIFDNNNNIVDTIFLDGSKKDVEFVNCTITNNIAANSGAINIRTNSNVLIKNSVIKGNKALNTSNSTGGINVNGTLSFDSGAIYNNQCPNGAKDLRLNAESKVKILTSSNMLDSTELSKRFEHYTWKDSKERIDPREDCDDPSLYIDEFDQENLITIPSKTTYELTAYENYIREYVQYKSNKYSSFKEVIDLIEEESSPKDELHLIELLPEAFDNDEYYLNFLAEEVVIDYNLQINLGGFTINNSENNLFKVINDGKLTLTGSGSLNGNIEINDNSEINLDFISNSNINIVSNNLDTKPIIVSSHFLCSEPNTLIITINDSFSEELQNNITNNYSKKIIDKNDCSLEALNINLINCNNSNLIYEERSDGLYIVNYQLPEGIFVKKGGDGDGTSFTHPESSLEEAIERAVNNSLTNIYILEPYSISNKVVLDGLVSEDSEESITISRLSLNDSTWDNQPLFTVNSNGNLTLKNVIIDGNSEDQRNLVDKIEYPGSLVKVNANGTLIIEDGTYLQNNDISQPKSWSDRSNYYRDFIPNFGGAIFASGNNSRIIMNGGTIDNCKAIRGAGIFVDSNSSFTMNDGSIQNNEAIISPKIAVAASSFLSSCGGGVCIELAKMNMFGGTISGNKAKDGGGICVGPSEYAATISSQNRGDNLVIGSTPSNTTDIIQPLNINKKSNITIEGNTASNNGGGIFIQATYQASIYEGDIINNICNGGGHFGGGGIYVNGDSWDFKVDPGILHINNVLIKDNKSSFKGAGIAGCSSSNTSIGSLINGSVIYNNFSAHNSNFGNDDYFNNTIYKDDLFVSTNTRIFYPNESTTGIKSNYGGYDSISKFMLDNTPYNWKLVDDDTSATDDYLTSNRFKSLYTPETPVTLDKFGNIPGITVRILGNSSASNGGGIGSNGTVIIDGYDATFEVTKKWENLSEKNKLFYEDKYLNYPNNLSQLNIWLFAQDNADGSITCISNQKLFDVEEINEDINNTVRFTKLDLDRYTPIIIEEAILNDGRCILSDFTEPNSETKISFKKYIITEIYGEEPQQTIIWSDEEDSPYSAVIEADDNGNYEITNSLETGKLSFTKEVIEVSSINHYNGESFDFTIILKDGNDTPISGNFPYNITDEDLESPNLDFNMKGEASIALKAGQTVTIEDLPIGVYYSIIEKSDPSYLTVFENDSQEGQIKRLFKKTDKGDEDTEIDNIFTIKNYLGRVVDLDIPIQKLIEGIPLLNSYFEFELAPPVGINYDDKIDISNDNPLIIKGGETKNFNIVFKEVGLYTFNITEIPLASEDYIFDNSTYNITVNIINDPEDITKLKVASCLIEKNGEITELNQEEPLTFTNTYLPKGDLAITKTVSSSDKKDFETPFEFTVTLEDTSINGTFGDLTFNDGVATTTLKHGETKVAKGLPAGKKYSVKETNYEGFTSSSTNEEGSIQRDSHQSVSFLNSKEEVVYSNLSVSKTVINGNEADSKIDFHFTVTLDDKSINGTFGEMEFKDGVANITLKSGETKTAKDLPSGINYTVTEEEANKDGFTTTPINDSGVLTGTVTATFINSKNTESSTGDLEISKSIITRDSSDTLTPEDLSQSFSFNIKLTEELDEEFATLSSDDKEGTLKFTKGNAIVSLQHGTSIKILGLPQEIGYTVTEVEVEGYTPLTKEFKGIIKTNSSICSFINYKEPEEEDDELPEITKEQSNTEESPDPTKDQVIAKANEEITYYLTVTNPTEEDMSNITVTDTIPNGLTYVNGSANQSGVSVSGSNLTWTIEKLEKGKEITLEFKVTVGSDLSILHYENTAVLDYNNKKVLSNTVTADSPILTIAKEQMTTSTDRTTGHVQFEADEEITYIIVVKNIGDVVATDTVVTDTTPEGLTYVSSDPTAQVRNGVLTWNIGDIEAGETIEIEVTFKLAEDNTSIVMFHNIAYVSWYEYGLPDPTPSNEVTSTIPLDYFSNNTQSPTGSGDGDQGTDGTGAGSGGSTTNTNSPTGTNGTGTAGSGTTYTTGTVTPGTTRSESTTTTTTTSPKTGISNTSVVVSVALIICAVAVLGYLYINNKRKDQNRS